MIITVNRVKNVVVNLVFLPEKMEKFVLQALTVILMIESAFHLVNLIKIVKVDTNAPMVIVSNLAQMQINVQIVNNIVTSKHKTHAIWLLIKISFFTLGKPTYVP